MKISFFILIIFLSVGSIKLSAQEANPLPQGEASKLPFQRFIPIRSGGEGGGVGIDLPSALHLVMSNQPLILQAEDQVRINEANIKEQNSSFLPSVNADLTDNVIGPTPSIPFGNEVFQFAPRNNFDGHVTVGYILYDFNRRGAEINLLKSYKLTAEERINLVKNELAYKTVQVFFAARFFEESRKIKEDQISILKRHIDDAQKRVNTGTAVDLDVLTTKVRVANAENELITLMQNLDKSIIALRNLTGIKEGQLNLVGNFDSTAAEADNNNLVQTAYTNREEMKIALMSRQTGEFQRESIKLNDLPALNLVGQYGLKNGYLPDLNAYIGNWILGARLSVPIFNGYKTSARLEAADAAIQSAGHNIDMLRRQIEMEVNQSVVDVRASKDKLNTIKIQIEQAQEALNKAQIQYEAGVIRNLDLLDAESSLTQTRLLYITALYQLTINTYNLRQAAGEKIW